MPLFDGKGYLSEPYVNDVKLYIVMTNIEYSEQEPPLAPSSPRPASSAFMPRNLPCFCGIAYLLAWSIMKSLVPRYKPIEL